MGWANLDMPHADMLLFNLSSFISGLFLYVIIITARIATLDAFSVLRESLTLYIDHPHLLALALPLPRRLQNRDAKLRQIE